MIRNRNNPNGADENDYIDQNHNVEENKQRMIEKFEETRNDLKNTKEKLKNTEEKLDKTKGNLKTSLCVNIILSLIIIAFTYFVMTNNNKITLQTPKIYSFGLHSYNKRSELFFRASAEGEFNTQTSVREWEKFNLECNENYEKCTITSAHKTNLLYFENGMFRFLKEPIQECSHFKLVKKVDREEYYYQLLTCRNDYIKFDKSKITTTKDSKDPNTFLSIKKE